MNGYYDNLSDEDCVLCDYTCLTCDAGTGSDCQSCDSAYNRTISGTQCTCDVGYYNINNVKACGICNYTWLSFIISIFFPLVILVLAFQLLVRVAYHQTLEP